jgi:acyl CoA:acetate/3-ketoacid CoA transferase alpha subunit
MECETWWYVKNLLGFKRLMLFSLIGHSRREKCIYIYMGFDGKTVQLVVDGKKTLKHLKQIEC